MSKKWLKLDFWFWVKAGIVLLMLMFLVYPFFSLLGRSFFSPREEGFTLINYIRFFTRSYYYNALGRSIFVSGTATVLTIIMGVPMAYLMTRYNVIGKKILHVAIIMSLMSPPFIGAYSWIVLFGRSGLVTQFFADFGVILPSIYGRLGIISVFMFRLFPFVYLFTSGAMGSIDASLEETAENLGSSRLRRLFTITLPVVLPSIAAGGVMVFMSSLADFGTPMLIGEGYVVLPVLVYTSYMSEMGGNANLASALSVIVVICSMAVLLLQKYYIAKKNYNMTAMRPPKVIAVCGGKRFLVTLPVVMITFIGILPQIVVITSSFIATDFTGFIGGFSIESYQVILRRLSTNIINTFTFSSIAIIIIIIIGSLISYIIARKRGLIGQIMDIMIMFPFVIPGAVLGIGLIVAFNRQPIVLTGTAAIMIIAYVVRKMPFTVRSGSSFLQQMDPCVEEAAISLGVSPMKTFFTVTMRLMAPGILSGAILSWITTINELSSSIMLFGGRTSTVAVAIYTEVIRNSLGTAAALATILTVSTIISLLIFLKVSKGRVSVI